jgi:hypothetical protein
MEPFGRPIPRPIIPTFMAAEKPDYGISRNVPFTPYFHVRFSLHNLSKKIINRGGNASAQSTPSRGLRCSAYSVKRLRLKLWVTMFVRPGRRGRA